MARIVLGIGTPHSPQLSTPVEQWVLHAERDKTNPAINFAELSSKAPDWIEDHLTEEAWEEKAQACENGVDKVSQLIEEVAPDILIVIGDDQKEMFLDDNIPSFAVFWGKEIYDLPHDVEKLPPSIRPAYWARHGVVPEAYPTDAELGRHIIETLVENEFDVSQFTEQPSGRSIGHAHTFVRRRLLEGKPAIKMVPILVNTFFSPNVPSPQRCYEFGRVLRQAIESWDSDQTVAIIASGGMSHFIIDEEFDRQFLTALERKDKKALTSIPKEKFVSGTSELLAWIAVAGAVEDLDMKLINYIPTFRTTALTGCGMGFVYWD